MDTVKDFFLFCSGIHPAILKRTPSDTNKYAGIGATIFFTGIFATIAASFAIHTVFKSYLIAVIVGILWGLMIFNLDRYIVMSMKKKSGFFKQLATATPRLMLAVLIAFVISKPLELKLFQSEIGAELVSMEQEVFKKQEEKLNARYLPGIDSLNSEISGLNATINEQTGKRDQLSLAAVQEADGTGGSFQRNLGPIYKAKKSEADKSQIELETTIANLSPIINGKRAQIAAQEARLESEFTSLRRSSLDGFAAQLEALGRLSKGSNTIWFASLFITLLFIAIETAPIFTKLISDRSPYDYKLDEHEYQFVTNHQLVSSKMKAKVETEISFAKEVNKYKTQQTIVAEKEIIAALIHKELENVKSQPLSWRSYLKNRSVFGS